MHQTHGAAGVLVVCADASIHGAIGLALADAGYAVREASSPTEAVGILRRSAHSLVVLLDTHGMEVLSLVAADRRLIRHHAYVLVCSDAVTLDLGCQHLLALVGALVLRTPFDKGRLLEIVTQAAGGLVAAP
jgi:DNA-binding NtrC family response regulator